MHRFIRSCSILTGRGELSALRSRRLYSTLLVSYREKLAQGDRRVWDDYTQVRDQLERQDFLNVRTAIWNSRNWGLEDRVLKVLQDMKKAGHAWGDEEYSDYFVAKLFMDQFQDIINVYEKEFKEKNAGLNTKSFNVVLITLLFTNQEDKAIRLIVEASENKHALPDVRDLERTIKRCMPTSDGMLSRRAKELIMEHGINDTKVLNLNLLHLFRDRNINQVRAMLKEYKGKLDIDSYNLIIKGFSEARMNRDAIAYYQEMEKKKMKPNIYICAFMLEIYAHTRDVPSAENVIRQTVLAGNAIDEVVYNQLIKVYFKARQPMKAFMAFQEVQKSPSLKVNEVIMNTMVNGLVINREMKAADQIYQQMIKSNSQLDIVTFNTMLKGYTDVGDLGSALNVVKDMFRFNIEPDTVTFTTFINSIFEAKAPKTAQEMINMLLKMGVNPNVYTFNTLINGWIRANKIEEAEKTFGIMTNEYRELRPTVHTFTNLIQGYTERMDMNKAMETFKGLGKYGIDPDRATFNFMIVGFLNFDRANDAYSCLERMNTMKLSPTKDTWLVMLNHCENTRDWAMGKKVIGMLDSSGFTISSYSLQRVYNKVKTHCT